MQLLCLAPLEHPFQRRRDVSIVGLIGWLSV